MKPPAEQKGEGWRDAKCRKCKSMSLDYGSDGWMRADDGALVREDVRPTREEMIFEMGAQIKKEGIPEQDQKEFFAEIEKQTDAELLTTFGIFWNARI